MMKTKIVREMAVVIMLVAVTLAFLMPAVTAADDETKVSEAYGALPLSFIENEGQVDNDVSYYLNGRQGTVYFTKEAIVYDLLSADASPSKETDPEDFKRLSFVLRPTGAEKDVKLTAEHELHGKVNYLIGNDPENWQTDIPTYKELIYKGLYKGIDLKVYGANNQMEYDFIVYPKADPEDIRMAFEGIDDLSVDEEGNLIIKTAFSELKHLKPVIYQEIDGKRHTVEGSFVVAEDTFGFDVADYDKSYPLIIDPLTLSYSTYLGGSLEDRGYGIAVDSSQNAYVTGYTMSLNFPTTPGAVQPMLRGPLDAFVTKLDPTGSFLIYSTFLGGNESDEGHDIAVDSNQSAYVTGYTMSPGFPTTPNAFQIALRGPQDAFVTKLDLTGTILLYSTFLGGNYSEDGWGITVDPNQDAHVTGWTDSGDFPVTWGAVQPMFGGMVDAFVTRLNTVVGGPLVYSTFLGGSEHDEGHDIAIDPIQDAYVTGFTMSPNFPITPGAFQPMLLGLQDAFVTKLTPINGAPLMYSTYLGGTSADDGWGIIVDPVLEAYVTGHTDSPDFPITPGVVQPIYGGWTDAFVTKLDPPGSVLIYSTYLGGSESDYGRDIVVDYNQSAYVTGWTSSFNFPIKDPFQAALNGWVDAFVTKLDPPGAALIYSTYLGGNESDYGHDIAVDYNESAYVTGWTDSPDFPTTPAAFDTTYNGGIDAFVTKLMRGTTPGTNTSGGTPTGVHVRNNWSIHQDQYPYATDLHFEIWVWEPGVVINGWNVTISNFTNSSSLRITPTDGVAVNADGAIIPFCTWVNVTIDLWLSDWNAKHLVNITWTNGTSAKKAMPSHGWDIDYPTPDPLNSGQYLHRFTLTNDDPVDLLNVSGLAFNATMNWYDDLESISFPAPYANFSLAPGQNWSTDISTTGDLVGGHIYFKYALNDSGLISKDWADHPVTPRPAPPPAPPAEVPAITPPGFMLVALSLLGLAAIVMRKMNKR